MQISIKFLGFVKAQLIFDTDFTMKHHHVGEILLTFSNHLKQIAKQNIPWIVPPQLQ